MMTYRDESLGPDSGDVTTWLYDEASNCMTNKVYADGKGPTYSYTADGKLSQRIWARGIITDYAYDGWNNLTNTTYSDGTPMVTLFYDAMGRQIEAEDAAGITTFIYDSFGALTNETVVGIAGTNTIIRHWDAYGRTTGYSLVGRVVPNATQRQTTIGYDTATGRIATMLAAGSDVPFTWSYLPDSDLKSSLAYPNGLTASWTYDANDQLLQVRNATPTNVISQYDYTYDTAGRRIEIARSGSAMSESRTDAYGYNIRNELTSASKLGGAASVPSTTEYAYQYDDIGNRITSTDLGTNRTYTANSLNQYSSISNLCDSASLREEFVPQFDDDGNQTLIQTSTGIWQVQYNGENRPIRWINGDTTITMSYDRMGRRVAKNDQWFVYDGYLRIADSSGTAYIWDPTERVATRPLVWLNRRSLGERRYYYTHDGNKNVSEVIAADGSVATHYKYAPFGAIVTQNGTSVVENPWCYSSECVEDDTATIYYNYRHLELETGRWMSRDPITETEDRGLYVFVGNQVGHMLDSLGLAKLSLEYETSEEGKMTMSEISEDFRKKFAKYSQDGEGPFNCLSHLRLIGHGSEGRISLGGHDISQFWIDSYLNRKAKGEHPPRYEPTEALDMLSLAASFACNDFTIEFVSCCSGRGDDGDYLKQSLRKLLGEKSNIILYEREVGMCFGFVIEKPYWLSWWESFGGGGKGQLKYARGKSK